MSMYKTIGIAVVLLAAFAFTSGSRSADASPTTPIGPAIVAHGKLPNQTAPIPTTTIFTPTQTGLYRLSVYATLLSVNPSVAPSWTLSLSWTDDAGPQSIFSLLAPGSFNVTGQFLLLPAVATNPWGGPATVFEAKVGQAITYSVIQNCPPDNSA